MDICLGGFGGREGWTTSLFLLARHWWVDLVFRSGLVDRGHRCGGRMDGSGVRLQCEGLDGLANMTALAAVEGMIVQSCLALIIYGHMEVYYARRRGHGCLAWQYKEIWTSLSMGSARLPKASAFRGVARW